VLVAAGEEVVVVTVVVTVVVVAVAVTKIFWAFCVLWIWA